jgi:hypothetical protein
VTEDSLLADQLTDHQQLVVEMPTGSQKAATTNDQGINAREVSLQVAELLLDGLADLTQARLLLLGHSKKLLPRLFAMYTRLVVKVFSDLRMHCIDQDFSHLPGFIEQ